jgi:hypothetical protein
VRDLVQAITEEPRPEQLALSTLERASGECAADKLPVIPRNLAASIFELERHKMRLRW